MVPRKQRFSRTPSYKLVTCSYVDLSWNCKQMSFLKSFELLKENQLTLKTSKLNSWSFELANSLPAIIELTKIDVLIKNVYYNDNESMKRIKIKGTLHLIGSRTVWILTGRTKTNNFLTKELIIPNTNNCLLIASTWLNLTRDWPKLSKQLMKLLLIFFNFLTH